MKKIITFSIILSLFISGAVFAETVSVTAEKDSVQKNDQDNSIKVLMDQLNISLINQKNTKKTYLGFVSSAAGKALVGKINETGEGVTIVTTKTAFCAMKKLPSGDHYCIDSNDVINSNDTCSKTNISCLAKTSSSEGTLNSNVKYSKGQLIALIMEIVKKSAEEKKELSKCDPILKEEFSLDSSFKQSAYDSCKKYISKDKSFCATLSVKDNLLDNAICYTSIALVNNDYSVCDNVSKPFSDYCYMVLIEKNNDAGKCDALSAGSNRLTCYTHFKKPITEPFCDGMKKDDVFQYDECLEQLALEQEDATFCSKISHYSGDYKGSDLCAQKVYINSNDQASCSGLPTGLQDDCYSGVALNKNDISVCEEVKDSGYRRDCITDIATQKNDISLCSMKDAYDTEYCYEQIAIKRGDISICKKISDESSDNCYTYFIRKAKYDNSICTFVKESLRDMCYRATAVSNIDHLSCWKFSNVEMRDACHAQIYTSCDMIKGDEERDTCLSQIFEKTMTLNPDLCKKIKDTEKANGCYLNVGYQSDPNYCDKIVNDQSLLELCYFRSSAKCNMISDESSREKCYQAAKK